jgi:phosphatidylglycerophosphatase A
MASTRGAEILGQKDPGIIVIDEIAGFLVAYFTAPFETLPLILPFLLFAFLTSPRFFLRQLWRSCQEKRGSC